MADVPNEDGQVNLETIEQKINNRNKVEERITDLSEKVRTASQERDAEKAARLKAEEEAKAKDKEVSFYKDFSKAASQFPNAAEFQDEIRTKVMSGYSTEDAIVSVLNSKGKLITKAPEKPIVAGGSSVTPPVRTAQKELHEMSREEKRAALLEEEKKGNIFLS